ncbi:hypothetical protein ACLMJK_002143 [Lecanora helva]
MEPLTGKLRQQADQSIECWDDDDDLQGIDDLNFRNVSSTTVGSATHHRDSTSSRLSTRSDRESGVGGDEDWQLLIPTDDEKATIDAINSAKTAGIPIPTDVPSSALLGGTIKRLGGRRLKKVLGDDWSEDIELPKGPEGGLKLKRQTAKDFSDSLGQFNDEFPISQEITKPQNNMTFMERMASVAKSKSTTKTTNLSLDKFRDDEDDAFFGDVPTIKVGKNRSMPKLTNLVSPAVKSDKDTENMEDDLELPSDGQPLRLSTRKEPRTPASQHNDDLDMEWAEGSLGTRFGGTRRDARSNPSSSISAFSPSASSCLTGESEDEGLEGLILPEGPLRFDEALQKRRENALPTPAERRPEKETVPSRHTRPVNDDFFTGIDIGDGRVFDSGKLTLNPKIVHKEARKTSPTRRPATTLTFTNKTDSSCSKIPKPRTHDRNRPALEQISESGGPVPQYRRPGSRIGHSAQSSLSALPTPSTPSSTHSAAPSTPVRRGLNGKSSRDILKSEPTTNPSQYLKAKRSAPAMRSQPSPGRNQQTYQRPPSRGGDYSSRQGLPSRPKTPVERNGAETSLANSRKASIPFLPAGTSHSQSHHVNVKSSRALRPSSSDSNENAPVNRPISRLNGSHHRPTTPNGRRDHALESLTREAASKRTLTKPTRRRQFGDGNELDIFDDLPTSASTESKFMKQPIARGAPKSVQMRSKLGLQSHNTSTTSVNELPPTATPSTPLSPSKNEPTPRFARDTNASRLAREHRMGSVSAALSAAPSLPTVREGGPLSSISTNRKTQPNSLASGKNHSMHPPKKRVKGPPQKPKLIHPMGEGVNSPKVIGDMKWNPQFQRWDGNENDLAPALAAFDPPQSPKSPLAGKAAPALIANVGSAKGVQMQNGMVFDPHRMCWLKAAPRSRMQRDGRTSNPMSPDTIEDEDDPFAGLDDLDDGKEKKNAGGFFNDDSLSGTTKNTGLVDDEWLVGEEFDVGPEFVKRQRAEEERWRTKVEGWVGEGVVRDHGSGKDGWKWAITKVLP